MLNVKRFYPKLLPILLVLLLLASAISPLILTQPAYANTTFVFSPDASPGPTSVDGYTAQTYGAGAGQDWGVLIAAAGSAASDTDLSSSVTAIRSDTVADKWRNTFRTAYLFDTSSLDDTATILSATLSIRGSGKADPLNVTPSINVYSVNPATDTALIAADFGTFGNTPFSSDFAYANWNTDAYNNFVLNGDGITAIDPTGITKFGIRNNYDVTGTPPVWSSSLTTAISGYFADQGAGYAPTLTITYASPTATTETVTLVSINTATLNGEITATGADGDAVERGFEWGLVDAPVSVQISTENSAAYNDIGISGIELPNGNLLAAWERFYFAPNTNDGDIKASISTDRGATWGALYSIQDTAGLRDIDPQFLSLAGTIYMFYTVADWDDPAFPGGIYYRTSVDNAATWSVATEVVTFLTYVRLDSDPIILASGRIVFTATYLKGDGDYGSTCYYSDDNCATWTRGADIELVGDDLGGSTVVQLSNGDLYKLMRPSNTGEPYQYEATSTNEGATWTAATLSSVQTPDAIACMLKVANGNIELLWNNVSSAGSYPRSPLTIANSLDDCASWRVKFNLAVDPLNNFGYSNFGMSQKANGNIIVFYTDETLIGTNISSLKFAEYRDDKWTELGAYGVGDYSHAVTGLYANSDYYVRAIARDSVGGWGYGSDELFTTLTSVSTQAITGVTMNAAGVTGGTLNGTLLSLDGEATQDVYFEYGLTVAYGSITTPVIVNALGAYTASMPANLIPGQIYHVRAITTTYMGTSVGGDQSFTFTMPTVATLVPTNVIMDTQSYATLRGNIAAVGVATSQNVYFQWGYTPALGTTTAVVVQAGTGIFTLTINNFDPSKTVYYRPVVGVGATVVNGSVASFKLTPGSGTGAAAYLFIYPVAIFVWLGVCVVLVWVAASTLGGVAAVIMAAIMVLLSSVGAQIILAALQSLW